MSAQETIDALRAEVTRLNCELDVVTAQRNLARKEADYWQARAEEDPKER